MFSNNLTCTTFRLQKSISGMFLTFICTAFLHASCVSAFGQDAPYPIHLSAGTIHTVQLHPDRPAHGASIHTTRGRAIDLEFR